MSIRRYSLQLTSFVALTMGILVGCGNDAENTQGDADGGAQSPADAGGAHDPHDVPLTPQEIEQLKHKTARYEEAVDHIQQYQATIQQETTSGEPAKAHRALDNLDVVLERLPEAARDSGVGKESWQQVNETSQKLRDLFNQVHANVDAGNDPNYEAVADEIDQGIQTLAAIEPEATD